ncbi:sodium:calcium antiporter [Candidatus Micrarchaeota archaeon]|nr:sodium:calcium antiporter [Candidatus Micrarchaeota archaeon]
MAFLEGITLLVSLIILSKSSSVAVDHAAKLSRFFGISQIALGFLLISVSTSLPELSVSILSANLHEGAIAAGNVFGSNIANILIVLGFGGFLYGLKIGKEGMKEIGLILLLTTVISAYIVFNSTVRAQALGFFEGVALLVLFAGYSIYVIRKNGTNTAEINEIPKKEALHSFIFFLGSIIVVLISSAFVVDSAVTLAKSLNIAESFIGATIIAIGTSLPELSMDLQAIRKKQYGLAIGDAIGSNMTNLTLVLGTAAVISPISLKIPIFIAALLFAIVSNMILFYVASINRELKRVGGLLFVLIYLVYLVTIFYLQISELS